MGKKRQGKNHFADNIHASVHNRYKLIRKLSGPQTAVPDTTLFGTLLDTSNRSCNVYADRGYPSIKWEARLKQAAGASSAPACHRKHFRSTEAVQPWIATPLACVEHIRRACESERQLRRRLGRVRTTFALQLTAATYNLKRLVLLKEGGLTSFPPGGGPPLAGITASRGLFYCANRNRAEKSCDLLCRHTGK